MGSLQCTKGVGLLFFLAEEKHFMNKLPKPKSFTIILKKFIPKPTFKFQRPGSGGG